MPKHTFSADASHTLDQADLGKKFAFAAAGTFGGGTLTLYMTVGGVDYVVWSTTEAASTGIEAGPQRVYKATLSGSTTPDLDIEYFPL